MEKLTLRQVVIISAYTGVFCAPLLAVKEYAEKLFERPLKVTEIVTPAFYAELRKLATPDFQKVSKELSITEEEEAASS